MASSLVLWKRRDSDYFYFEVTEAQKVCLANVIQDKLHLLNAYMGFTPDYEVMCWVLWDGNIEDVEDREVFP